MSFHAIKKKLLEDLPPMRVAEAKLHQTWEPIPTRDNNIRIWKTGTERLIDKLANTAAHQIRERHDEDAASTILKIQCAKANLLASMTRSAQTKQIRDHLSRTADEIETKEAQLHDVKKDLDDLQGARKQLANILHDLRGEDSDSSAADDGSCTPGPRPKPHSSASRADTPQGRRHRGHIGSASPHDPTDELRRQLKDLQDRLTKQEQDHQRAKERATKHYESQLKQTEDKVKTAKEDAHEAKTRFERHQREQTREHKAVPTKT